MKEIDFELLKNDIEFPLKWDDEDYNMYIFDKDMNMVAQVELEDVTYKKGRHPFNAVIGKMKVDERTPEEEPFFFDRGDFYSREYGIRIGCVRGWGRLSYQDNAEASQDNIANYILQCLNKELV